MRLYYVKGLLYSEVLRRTDAITFPQCIALLELTAFFHWITMFLKHCSSSCLCSNWSLLLPSLCSAQPIYPLWPTVAKSGWAWHKWAESLWHPCMQKHLLIRMDTRGHTVMMRPALMQKFYATDGPGTIHASNTCYGTHCSFSCAQHLLSTPPLLWWHLEIVLHCCWSTT